MSICENCEHNHNGTYGSGRFCSSKCSRGFSTKAKRTEINHKISKSLAGRKYKDPLFCKNCNTELSRKRKYNLCNICLRKSPEYRELLSKNSIGKNLGSKNGMYGISPPHTKPILVYSEKHTKQKEFKVRSSYEAKYVKILNADPNIKKFTYEPSEFKAFYLEDGIKERSYQPDFLINDNLIIEIKNPYNASLKETKQKELAFIEQFSIPYKILIL